MKSILERVSGFVQKKPRPIPRTGASYAATEHFCSSEIKRYVEMHQQCEKEDQTTRLLEGEIDLLLRNYHNYNINKKSGAHYREKGLVHGTKTQFEHIIPVVVARGLLLEGRITIDEALNIPTCKLSEKNHKKLGSNKLGTTTPDIGNFLKRYQLLDIEIETRDGLLIDTATWTLQQHYDYFAHLKI